MKVDHGNLVGDDVGILAILSALQLRGVVQRIPSLPGAVTGPFRDGRSLRLVRTGRSQRRIELGNSHVP